MTPDSVWDVLVKHAGATDTESMRSQFRAFWPRRDDANEFRFMGELGFGGKIWFGTRDQPYVTCYREDMDTRRKKIIDRTNNALQKAYSGNARADEGQATSDSGRTDVSTPRTGTALSTARRLPDARTVASEDK